MIKVKIPELLILWKQSDNFQNWKTSVYGVTEQTATGAFENFMEWKNMVCQKNKAVISESDHFILPLDEIWFENKKDYLIYQLKGLRLD